MGLSRSVSGLTAPVAAAAAVAAGATGCGKEADEAPSSIPAARVAGVDYSVPLSRPLDPRGRDRRYFSGRSAPRGSTYYAVFVEACNNGSRPRAPSGSFRLVDAEGREAEPVPVPRRSRFAYRPRELRPRECIPEPGTIAVEETGGEMLLFRLSREAVEEDSLELKIGAPKAAATGPEPDATVELER